MMLKMTSLLVAVLFALSSTTALGHAVDVPPPMQMRVDTAARAIMAKYRIPGMAVGVIADGKSYVFNYGVASREANLAVSTDTLFEIGSISKTFTATLVSYAQVKHYLSLSDKTSKYLPSLRGSKFGDVSLLELGTHTPGGLPLQVPDGIRSTQQLMQWFRRWQPSHAPGTYRTYSNISIGTLGLITARSMHGDFTELMEQRVFPALGLAHTFIKVPAQMLPDYAQGYTPSDAPIRLSPGVLFPEAYGIKATVADMLRFLQANMGLVKLGPEWQQAIADTHTGYFKAGVMTQELIWEQYQYPVALKTLLQGNSPTMIFAGTPVTAMAPAQKPKADVWINKTGSTNGFGAYVAFIPEQRSGIVILANKNYPIGDRVTMAYDILASLRQGKP
ncbi:MAG: class C beta-lactamase [Rhodanobacter sp.]